MSQQVEENPALVQEQPMQDEGASLTAQLAFLDNSIVEARAKIKELTKTRRNFLGIGVLCAFALGLHYGNLFLLPIFVVVGAWILSPLFFLAGLGTDPDKPRIELEKLESTKRLYFNFLNIKTDEAYFDQLVKINIENLSDYYTLVKIHTGQSFKLSLIVAIAGFVMISVGLGTGFVNETLRNISYLSAGSGIIVEFIAGVMFYLYSKTVRQLKAYHDSLLDVQNILLSFKLIEGTVDEKERSTMTQKMIEFLAGRRNISKNN